MESPPLPFAVEALEASPVLDPWAYSIRVVRVITHRNECTRRNGTLWASAEMEGKGAREVDRLEDESAKL